MSIPSLAESSRKKKSQQNGDTFYRLPPHSPEAEQGVLGCILLDPKCYLDAKEVIESTEVFYELPHQVIWDSMDEKADIIILQQRLKDKGLLDQVGGISYLNQLQDAVPSAVNLFYYIDIIKEKHLLRKMLTVSSEIQTRLYEFTGDVDKLADEYERDVLSIRSSYTKSRFADVKATVGKIMERVQHVMDKHEPIGMTTGFEDMDSITGGFDTGLHIISGERSAGKTSLAFNIADYRIFHKNEKVCVISLETGAVSALTRMICCRMRIDSRQLRTNPSREDMDKLAKGNRLFLDHGHKLLICQDSGLTDMRIRAICRRARHAGATLFIVDYLQLIQTEGKRTEATERVGRAVYSMKDMSKELDAPVLLIAGLSRAGELRNSNEADYAADTHIKLKKPEGNKRDETVWRVKAQVEKSKDAGEGKFELDFYRNYFCFQTCPRVEEGDVPYAQD